MMTRTFWIIYSFGLVSARQLFERQTIKSMKDLFGSLFGQERKPRQEANLSEPFVSFRDDDHRPINRGDSALLQFSPLTLFYAVMQLFSHQCQ
jgi:hypothetical protein